VARLEQTWSMDAFDAVSIRAHDCTLDIRGVDGDQVKLEGDGDERPLRNLWLSPAGRWLLLHPQGHTGGAQFTLQLPKDKVWAVDLFAGKVEFKAENLRARLNLMCGRGEIQVEKCRGIISVVAGNGSIRIKHFDEAEMPVMPPLPGGERQVNQEEPESWPDWWEDYGMQWRGRFGEKILKRLFGPTGEKSPGVNLQTGKGDMQLEDIKAGTCIIRSARGDVKLKGGSLTGLDLVTFRGDIECESCLPGGDWGIRVTRGDIRISLPPDARARLDVATRHGEIRSQTPLVRVTRQGPEAWHGSRMVGTVGTSGDGSIAEIHMTTKHGDIKIDAPAAFSRNHAKTGEGKLVASQAEDRNVNSYHSVLDVLTALSEGRISVEEADRLLRKLKT
jgi:hypothetical protein